MTMTINKEQAVSDAIERIVEEIAVHDETRHEGMIGHGLVYVRADDLRTILAASHPLEQQQAVSGDEARLLALLNDAGAENLCLVWYRGHAFPLIGEKDGEGNYLLRGSPYDDSFAFANEVDFVLPLQAISTLTAEVERRG